ncbi:uncharacterized protein TrAtP1_007894 [Trichoderma atroviride]|uniref:uncharacterized protein n=1 Tax=Hypocrea atroviridis TaxID=63577 RepID=UPI003327FCB0|nr:hypothetical protein TrAtP1_007894 [Trichoderma atroviride]
MRRPGWTSYCIRPAGCSTRRSNHRLAIPSRPRLRDKLPRGRRPFARRQQEKQTRPLGSQRNTTHLQLRQKRVCRCLQVLCGPLSTCLTSRFPSLSSVHRSSLAASTAGDALARAQAIANMDPDLDSGLREGLDGVETNANASASASASAHAHAYYDSQTSIPNPPGFFPGPAHDSNAQVLADHAAATLDPDDFYKSFQPARDPEGEPQSLPMASPVPHALPSSADGAAARHLQPPANRSAGRQGLRSASSPLDRRAAATTRSSSTVRAPSVKDLKKRFDQSGGANSIPRAPPRQEVPVARIRQDSIKPKPKPKPQGPSPSAYSSAGPRPGVPAPGSSKQPSSSAASTASSNRPLQKSRTAERDQMPGSSRSFANRIGNHPPPPDTSANGNSIASSSLTHRPHNSPPSASQPAAPSPKSNNSQFPGLLFGEVAPGQHSAAAAGFGIDNLRPRRTSESNVDGLAGRQRSFSDLEAEPASPSSWYRDLQMPRGSAPKAHHARSRSDISILPFMHHKSPASPTTTIAALAAATATATAVAAAEAAAPPPPASHTPAGASSKLPVSISRRLATPSDSSPTSSRSNSPSTLRRPPTNVRSSSRQAKANPPYDSSENTYPNTSKTTPLRA